MGLSIGGRSIITDLRYEDELSLLTHDITSIKIILHGVDTEGRKEGLHLNVKKTKVLHINGRENIQNIKVINTNLEVNFKYLTSIKENTGSCRQVVKTRTAMVKNLETQKHLEKQRHTNKPKNKFI